MAVELSSTRNLLAKASKAFHIIYETAYYAEPSD